MSYEGDILRIYLFSPGKIKLLFNKKLNYIYFLIKNLQQKLDKLLKE